MRRLTFLFALWLLTCPASAQVAAPASPLVVNRIKWLYQLKQQAARRWPAFRQRRYEVPLAYYTATETYVANPDAKMIRRQRLQPCYRDRRLHLYRSPARLDDRPFHMETAYDETDSTLIYYRAPVLLCSDFETTARLQPDVPHLQKWATMVVHEYFHGFQLRHSDFLRYANDSIPISGSRLQALHDAHPWYRSRVAAENRLLLQCLMQPGAARVDSLLREFGRLRAERHLLVRDSLHLDLARQEAFYEKLEGSARYLEWQLLQAFRGSGTRYRHVRQDPAYQPGAYARFALEQEPWLYESNSVRYFYATGFNLLRLLDQLGIRYQDRLFTEPALSLDALLRRRSSP